MVSFRIFKQDSASELSDINGDGHGETLPRTHITSGIISPALMGGTTHDQEVLSDSESNQSKPESVEFPMLSDGTVKKPTVEVEKRTADQIKWDKKHNCKFCNKMKTKMSGHLQRLHKNEAEVAAIMALPKYSKERRQGFIKLLHEGDYDHNVSVLRTGSGCFIPKYRSKDRKVVDCLTCPHCKGLYLKTLLSKHISRCPEKPEDELYKRGTCRKMANMMLPVSFSVSASFQEKVLRKMNPDDIYRLIRGDSLILMFGERLFEKRDVEEHTSGQIGGRLREVGMLLQLLRRKSGMTVSNLTAALDPANFDILIACVRELAEYDDNSHMYKKGSLALKVGYALKKCSQILAAEAIKSNDQVMLDKVAPL